MLSNEHVEIIRSMKRRLDTMENDGDMFGQGFNHAIDRVCKLLEAEPPSGAESGEIYSLVDQLCKLGNEPFDGNSDGNKMAQRLRTLLASRPAESAKTVPLEMLIAVRQDLPVCATRDQMQEIAARYGYTVTEGKEEER